MFRPKNDLPSRMISWPMLPAPTRPRVRVAREVVHALLPEQQQGNETAAPHLGTSPLATARKFLDSEVERHRVCFDGFQSSHFGLQ